MEPAHTLVIGSTQSGKSYLTNYLIQKHLSKIYGLVILVSGSINAVDSSDNDVFSSIPKKNRASNLSNRVMQRIITFARTNKNVKVLVVLDDMNKMLSKTCVSKANKQLALESIDNINYIFTEGRHNNIYACALVQYYKQLQPTIRCNARYQILLFGNATTLEAMYDYVDNSFQSLREFKDYVYENNVTYKTIIDDQGNEKSFMTALCFDTHSRSRELQKNIMLIQP